MRADKHIKGITFIGTIIGISIMTILFVAMFSTFNAMLHFAKRNQFRSNAIMLANEHIEKIRAMPFDSVGTVGGLPSGQIPQNESIVFDGHTYNKRTFIQYVDDPADGLGASDSLTADYKRIKVEMSYDYNGATQSFSIVTTVAPKSQESLTGAGVLRINVTDALNNPIWMASVHVVNNTVATSVNITTFTNASGTVSFPGAWAGGGYEVYVSKSGYSSAQTYTSSSTNPNPSPSPYNVAENGTTEVFFKIDKLSNIHLVTQSQGEYGRLFDSFADTSKLSSLTNTQVSTGALILSGSVGTYSLSGSATSTPVSPTSLDSWLLLSFDDDVPANTTAVYQIEYDTGGGVFQLVPDSDLPLNSAGFTSSPVALYNLSTTTYTTLRITTKLNTTDTNVTPKINDYSLSYKKQPARIANINFDIHGNKIMGTNTSGDPIYKYDKSFQTSATGVWDSGDIEWDTYALTMNSAAYTVAKECPVLPIVLEPDTDFEQVITLETPSTNSLEINVADSLGNQIEHAEVNITYGAIDETDSTGPCGNVYFPSLAAGTYSVHVQAYGFSSTTKNVTVSGNTTDTVTL
jgi:type II secretory pathway pseudopilin PulG